MQRKLDTIILGVKSDYQQTPDYLVSHLHTVNNTAKENNQ